MTVNSRDCIHWPRAEALAHREHDVFVQRNPQSRLLAERAAQHLLFGVPLHWMTDWGTPFGLQVANARGAPHRGAGASWCSTAASTAPSTMCSSTW